MIVPTALQYVRFITHATSVVFQKLRRRNLQNVCNFEQRLQTHAAHRSRAFDLRQKVQADANLFGKVFLRVSALFAIIGYLQAESNIALCIFASYGSNIS